MCSHIPSLYESDKPFFWACFLDADPALVARAADHAIHIIRCDDITMLTLPVVLPVISERITRKIPAVVLGEM